MDTWSPQELSGSKCQVFDIHDPIIVDISPCIESCLAATLAERGLDYRQIGTVDFSVTIYVSGIWRKDLGSWFPPQRA